MGKYAKPCPFISNFQNKLFMSLINTLRAGLRDIRTWISA